MSWSPRAAQLSVVAHLVRVRQPQSPSAPVSPPRGPCICEQLIQLAMQGLIWFSILINSRFSSVFKLLDRSCFSQARMWVGDSGARVAAGTATVGSSLGPATQPQSGS